MFYDFLMSDEEELITNGTRPMRRPEVQVERIISRGILDSPQ